MQNLTSAKCKVPPLDFQSIWIWEGQLFKICFGIWHQVGKVFPRSIHCLDPQSPVKALCFINQIPHKSNTSSPAGPRRFSSTLASRSFWARCLAKTISFSCHRTHSSAEHHPQLRDYLHLSSCPPVHSYAYAHIRDICLSCGFITPMQKCLSAC